MLATFERAPELIDVVALHLLERHFAPGLHKEILEAVGLELGTSVATRRRDMATWIRRLPPYPDLKTLLARFDCNVNVCSTP